MHVSFKSGQYDDIQYVGMCGKPKFGLDLVFKKWNRLEV